MPEGHSVRRLAIQFQDVFAGRRLSVSSPQGRFAEGAALLDGRVMTHAHAHGKQLFLGFEDGLWLHVHLGLYGAWEFGGDSSFRGASSIGAPRRIGEREKFDDDGDVAYVGPPEPVGAVRVRLVSEHGWADLRGASRCDAVTGTEAEAAWSKLGPDPLHDGFEGHDGDGAEFVRRLRAKRTAVGQLLMDQGVVAGIGNIYRAEMLYRAGIDPFRPGTSLSGEEAGALWRDAVKLLADGVRDGRIITTDPGSWAGEAPADDEAFYVYQKQGRPCGRCGTPIALKEMAGRKLYWCPGCQH
ncbi:MULTISPECIES: DNA-formamidopyrimidine glycosylase family protein [Arthrobacter]|uniref:DNA-(apurinic or apyrimidinic site) lyase n=2 Tax=Arthrobacter TaxID=1663 RepID=A0ABU9KFK4_9MICC|nr:DNA-formamidopyrimidine glycosylase family protein [Arthrobacter sp. YJM1]MDP5225649.1 DNA-formamidopyrimidine glycosylase family protein [Arthrobacter sp. YJM1]